MTSLALGNIEIDQAVVNAIAAMIAAANVTLGRMTPTSGSIGPHRVHWRLSCGESVNYFTQTGIIWVRCGSAAPQSNRNQRSSQVLSEQCPLAD